MNLPAHQHHFAVIRGSTLVHWVLQLSPLYQLGSQAFPCIFPGVMLQGFSAVKTGMKQPLKNSGTESPYSCWWHWWLCIDWSWLVPGRWCCIFFSWSDHGAARVTLYGSVGWGTHDGLRRLCPLDPDGSSQKWVISFPWRIHGAGIYANMTGVY